MLLHLGTAAACTPPRPPSLFQPPPLAAPTTPPPSLPPPRVQPCRRPLRTVTAAPRAPRLRPSSSSAPAPPERRWTARVSRPEALLTLPAGESHQWPSLPPEICPVRSSPRRLALTPRSASNDALACLGIISTPWSRHALASHRNLHHPRAHQPLTMLSDRKQTPTPQRAWTGTNPITQRPTNSPSLANGTDRSQPKFPSPSQNKGSADATSDKHASDRLLYLLAHCTVNHSCVPYCPQAADADINIRTRAPMQP